MTFIIAEIGSNHLCNLDLAYKHIESASKVGADAVKFQYFKAESDLANRPDNELSSEYDNYINETDYEFLKSLEIPIAWLEPLKKCADKNNIELFFSCSDTEALNEIAKISNRIKIASCDIDNLNLLSQIKKLFDNVILSTGSADYNTILNANNYLAENTTNKTTILYCVSEYPMLLESYDMNAIASLKSHFDNKIGYSDHAKDWQASAVALSQGIDVLERHFVIDKNINSPDVCVSSDTDEFRAIVEYSNKIERKDVNSSFDVKNIFNLKRNNKLLRRSPVTKANMSAGKIINLDEVEFLRPAIGMDAFEYLNDYMGKRISRNIKAGEYLNKLDFVDE